MTQNPHIARCPSADMSPDRSIPNLWTFWAANPPSSHTYEQVRDPKYFGAFRTRYPKSPRANDGGLRIGDVIYVRPKDNSYQAELLVVDMPDGMDEVHTREISKVDFVSKDVPSGYSIKHYGPHRGWCIEINDVMIETGFVTHEQATNRAKWFEQQNAAQERVAAARAKTVTEEGEKPTRGRGRRKKSEEVDEEAEVVEEAA